MLVLDALCDDFQQISSNVEIVGSLVGARPFRQLTSELGANPERLGTSNLVPSSGHDWRSGRWHFSDKASLPVGVRAFGSSAG